MKIEIPTIPLISICTGSGLNQKYTDPTDQLCTTVPRTNREPQLSFMQELEESAEVN